MITEIFTYIDPEPPVPANGGSLEGITVAVQPTMGVRGWPTEAGSVALERYVALEDATVVDRLRREGATIIGSTRISELGFGLVGDTSARAVSEGAVDVALAMDTMGEARIAAASAHLFGYKPSYGIVSRFGLIGLIPSMECFGMIARTPREISSVLSVMAGKDDHDFSMSDEFPDFESFDAVTVENVKLGVVREAMEFLDQDAYRAFRSSLSYLEKAGMSIREVSLDEYDLFRTIHNVIGSVEASSSAGKYDGVRYGHRAQAVKNWNEMYLKSRGEAFGLPVKAYLFQGAYFQFENYEAFDSACRIRSMLVRLTESLHETVDYLILPMKSGNVSASDMKTIDEIYGLCSHALPANVTGVPVIYMPGGLFGRETDPGFQLLAPRLGDARLLAFAAHLFDQAEGGV